MAKGLLRAQVRGAPLETRRWAAAMLRELDYVDGDWEALWWALGSATALLRHRVPRQGRSLLTRRLPSARDAMHTPAGKTSMGVLSGTALAAGVMAICLWALVTLPNMSWTQVARAPMMERALIAAGLEATCVVLAIVLWRRRRSAAAGALVAGVLLVAHVVTHNMK